MISSEDFLKIMKPSAKDNSFVLGRIDATYSSGRPKIIFDGESEESQKKYPYLSSYTPAADDRVLLAKVNGSFVILGKII